MTATEQAVEPITDPTYTSAQIVNLTGSTYRQIDYWTRCGYLTETANGSGSTRRYDATELDTVRLVLALQRLGFTLNPAFDIARRLVSEDDYRTVIADIYEVVIRVNPALTENTPTEETP